METLRASAEPIAILEGQTPPSRILDVMARSTGVRYAIVMLDCAWAVREHRLSVLREQPELASADMLTWAEHLKREADALSVPVIDTTDRSIAAIADAVLEHALALLGDDGPARPSSRLAPRPDDRPPRPAVAASRLARQ